MLLVEQKVNYGMLSRLKRNNPFTRSIPPELLDRAPRKNRHNLPTRTILALLNRGPRKSKSWGHITWCIVLLLTSRPVFRGFEGLHLTALMFCDNKIP